MTGSKGVKIWHALTVQSMQSRIEGIQPASNKNRLKHRYFGDPENVTIGLKA